jgi:WD40 repeat protein
MLLSHRGWESISTPREPVEPPDAAWRRAADEAFFGTGSADGRILCLMPTETRFEMWNTKTDSVAVSRPARVEELVATPRGCFAKAGREVTFYDRSGGKTVLCDDAGVVDGNEDDVLVACGDELYLFDAGGVRLASFAMSRAATALAVTHDAVITGNASGRLLRSSRGGGEPRELALDKTPPAPVTLIEPGPAGTVVAGFGDGILGLWDLQTGARLRSVRLHGRALHLRLRGQSLYAASELGDTRAWDLGVYHRDYCDLMQDVWRDVPLVWQGGRPVLAEPPAQHPCAGTGGSLGTEG